MAIYFRAADRREVPASEALDSRGCLRHGYGQRVPAHLRDAAPRFAWDQHRASLTDGRRAGVQANRPGFRILTDDDAGRQAVVDARAAYIWNLENAWRNPPPRDAAFGSLDKKIKRYNARGQEEGYFEETEEGDAASVGDARKKEDPPPVTGRSKCPECDGRGVVHGKYCQGCGGDGWVDDDDDEADDDMPQGELEQMTSATDRRTIDQMSRDHSVAMQRIYDARNREISEAWREGKATND